MKKPCTECWGTGDVPTWDAYYESCTDCGGSGLVDGIPSIETLIERVKASPKSFETIEVDLARLVELLEDFGSESED